MEMVEVWYKMINTTKMFAAASDRNAIGQEPSEASPLALGTQQDSNLQRKHRYGKHRYGDRFACHQRGTVNSVFFSRQNWAIAVRYGIGAEAQSQTLGYTHAEQQGF